MISGLSVSPRRRRCGLYFLLSPKNIQHPEVCAFLRDLLRHLRGPVIVIWDNGTIHGGDAIRALVRGHHGRQGPLIEREAATQRVGRWAYWLFVYGVLITAFFMLKGFVVSALNGTSTWRSCSTSCRSSRG